MSIINKIYEDYCERHFRVKPDLNDSRENSKKVNEFEEALAMSEEQKKKFEDLMFELCCDSKQSAFSDGFKAAFDLMFEIAK